MKYDLRSKEEINKLKRRLNALVKKQLIVDLTVVHQTRTVTQNSYYWVLITLIGGELGYTKDEMHEFFKKAYNKITGKLGTKKELEGIEIESLNTRNLDIEEFNQYVDFILEWCGLHGINAPTIEQYKTNKVEIDKQMRQYEAYQDS